MSPLRYMLFHVAVYMPLILAGTTHAQQPESEIPAALQPWKGWVLWDERDPNCPTPFNASDQHICFWASQLKLSAGPDKGSWELQVHVFEESWVPLPGNARFWPTDVRVNEQSMPVVEHDSQPSVKLPTGVHQLTGQFLWTSMPQKITLPKQVGILALVIDGQSVAVPSWDATGDVWLRREQPAAAEKDLLAVQVYRVLEDGIPLWLRTEIDVTISGKNREEQLGWILPEGWQLSFVGSPIPVAVDELGQMKAQVRAGNWKIRVDAFYNAPVEQIRFAPGIQPMQATELIGFRAKPEFRITELEGLQPIDVSQTTFPDAWRKLPVFQWNTATPFQLVEKMRGTGQQRPTGLDIVRQFWLDDNGQDITYVDHVSGQLQQSWRLDVAQGQELGAVRVDGQPQLITANPQSGVHGVEIRSRNPKLQAIGRIPAPSAWFATGWEANADSLQLTLSLPPGWRVFALFGADRVDGDWLTAWSLLDLFLLLIFSMAVFRLWGIPAGIIALLAFGLSYHEPGAPRLTWLFLLIPIALLRVVTQGQGKTLLAAWRNIAVALLLLNLLPFAAKQIQSAIYPQLESAGRNYASRSMFEWLGLAYESGTRIADYASESLPRGAEAGKRSSLSDVEANLALDPKARIQTGPAQPEWSGNQVVCSWSGPVSSTQQIVPILVSQPVYRGLTVVRLALLVLLFAIVLGMRWRKMALFRRPVAVAALLFASGFLTPAAWGQIPDQEMLNTLRERLLQADEAYPHAAEIASVDLSLRDSRLVLNLEIHAAIDVAVPLPGRLPDWSPLSVEVDGEADSVVCRRDDGYLWLSVSQGVHQVTVEGWLADAAEWDWTYLLAPHRVAIDAPGWNISGLRPDGVPESHILLTRELETSEGEASYDQRNFRAIAAVERRLEVGLQWKIHNTVNRLSEPGKAISIRVPLLPGESVLTANAVVEDDAIEVNLGANQQSVRWESELAASNQIQLTAAPAGQWIERWYLLTSPAWNANYAGLEPVYEADQQLLIPTWHPWPSESVTLSFRRPQAIDGPTVTVQSVMHETRLGARQRESKLQLKVESSLGNDFAITLDEQAFVSSLKLEGREIPVRREGALLIAPLPPGEQTLEATWTTAKTLPAMVSVEPLGLPVNGANVTTVLRVPENRWVLWADGPLRGPAVRFWTIIASALLAALALGSLSLSPLSRLQWVLLALGLTQVHVAAALLVVGWLFLVAWRAKQEPAHMGQAFFNLTQLLIVLLTVIVLGIFIVVVGQGLLGNPRMFILGNGSSQTYLKWYQPLTETTLPQPYILSISVWFYRLLMLFWALWLATALLRWLQNGWTAFSHGGCWKRPTAADNPPIVEATQVE
jgi:hypothetical protein